MANNFTSAAPTINAALAACETYGEFRRAFQSALGTATAATVNSGSVVVQRATRSITIPSMGAGVAGLVFTQVQMSTALGGTTLIAGLEYDMGTLTVSGNSFADGVAMPTKNVSGASKTTAAALCYAVVSTTLTGATTPTLTTTYTDQDGNPSNSCAITLPTNPVIGSGFFLQPHLANGDTAIRDVTNMSISTGTGGAIKIYGILPIGFAQGTTSAYVSTDLLQTLMVPWLAEAGEKISFYRHGIITAGDMMAFLAGVPEPS